MGKKALLFSCNQHVDGMVSGGLTASDLLHKEAVGGLALEFFTRIGQFYQFRPSQAEALFLQMLKEARVEVYFERFLESVTMEDDRVVSATFLTGETVRASVFVDATYEGDLLAAAGVSYRVGREPACAYGETLAGQWQDVIWGGVYQFCGLPLSPYVEPDNPGSGLLPEISPERSGARGKATIGYRLTTSGCGYRIRKKGFPFPSPGITVPNAMICFFVFSTSTRIFNGGLTTPPIP